MLWPPNHRMVNVTVSYDVTDTVPCHLLLHAQCGPATSPVNGKGDGDTSPDWIVLDDHHVANRAHARGNGNGRNPFTINLH